MTLIKTVRKGWIGIQSLTRPALTSLRCVRPDKSGKQKENKKTELNLQWVEECAEDSSVRGEPLIHNW